jgi:zinc D-Ala-D-Ala carboxypeptidase
VAGVGRRAGVAVVSLALAVAVANAPAAHAAGPVTPATGTTSATPSAPSPTDGRTSGSGTYAGAATATPGTGGEQTLSPQELAGQVAAAQALTSDLTTSNAAIAAAMTKLDRLAVQANTLLQEYATAREEARTARADADRDVVLFQRLSTQLGEDQDALGQWAYQAYAGTGGSLSDLSALIDALSKPPEEASDTAAQLSYLSDQRTHTFERVRDHTALQREVAARAVEASTRATEAAQRAADAKAKLDTVIADQKVQLEATRKLHEEQVAKAAPISGLLLGSGDATALETSRALRKAVAIAGISPDGSVKACSTNEATYPNGQVPAAGLCPLLGDPSQSLRPGAAAAFNALSLAYQRDTGQPLCITDSYRSYAEQIAVKATRGKWAAAPGTSEHGKGLAVDFCGGVQSFGSPAHLWLKQNAPLYGWFHPNWAEPTGALPEPWHWEYAG